MLDVMAFFGMTLEMNNAATDSGPGVQFCEAWWKKAVYKACRCNIL
jgi:hypothetical protein